MNRHCIALSVAIFPLMATSAWASGIPMAEQWDLARDGGRIFNAAVVLGAIAYVVVRFGGPILRKRAELIAERLEELEKARANAEKSLGEYEQRVREIEAEGERIKAEATEEGELIRKKIVEQAEKDARRIVGKASEQIRIETEKVKADLRRKTTLAAIELAEQLLKKNIKPDDQKNLLEKYFASVEKRN